MAEPAYVGNVNMSYHHGNLRDALLEEAAKVIAERGIESLSLRELARGLDVSHAAPRRHFEDKRALLTALAREGHQRTKDAILAGAEEAGPDPVLRYRAMGRAYVQFALENPAYFRAINHPEVLGHADPELRSAQRDYVAAIRLGATQAQQAGWHEEVDVDVLLAFSMAAAMGTAALLSESAWSDHFGTGDLEDLADAVLRLVVERSEKKATTPNTNQPSERESS